MFVDVFNTLPLAATIADKIFVFMVVHPDLKDLNQIQKIQDQLTFTVVLWLIYYGQILKITMKKLIQIQKLFQLLLHQSESKI